MNYIDMVNETIEYIDRHIHEEISLDILSSKYYCSKFYFHRLFQSFTGKPLIQYVRERKIAKSALLLLETKKKIIDIAFEMGFILIRHLQGCLRITME